MDRVTECAFPRMQRQRINRVLTHRLSLENIDGALSSSLFVYGDTGWNTLLHRFDMTNDTDLTAL